jgi:erythromycin esterase-like protein
MSTDSILAQAIANLATPLTGAASDLDPLMDRIGDARFVLLGEATHGSHEFYKLRAELTKRLIREKGFGAIATEGDWPDTYRVDRFIRGDDGDPDAETAMDDFRRFPQWMWRNTDILDLVRWLRAYNAAVVDEAPQVGMYGLDVYSLHGSMAAVLGYLDREDPAAAARARERYACFDGAGDDPQRYAYQVALGLSEDCERGVVAQLTELLARRQAAARPLDRDRAFDAEQNARVVVGAEAYYRQMYAREVSTWNLRDTHMIDTLDGLARHLAATDRPAKIVVWAHNSHCGDSSAMDHRTARDEITLGHLCRRRHPGETVLVGFTTHHGTVTAASDWDGEAERKRVRPALAHSYELLFHQVGLPRFLLRLDELGEATSALHEPRLERAIGVLYRPDTERHSHYFHVDLPSQFDAVIHLDETHALRPLERTPKWERGELPETYPTGL